jgi:hypothetical protein
MGRVASHNLVDSMDLFAIMEGDPVYKQVIGIEKRATGVTRSGNPNLTDTRRP